MTRPVSERKKQSELPEVAVGIVTYLTVVTAYEATDQYGLWGWPDIVLGAVPAALFWVGMLVYGSMRVKREKAPVMDAIEDLRRYVADLRRRPS
jgi:hypothetical protein